MLYIPLQMVPPICVRPPARPSSRLSRRGEKRQEAMQFDGPFYRRWWKVWLFPRCCLPCNAVLHPCRAGVSQNKTRYQQDGFDLDLTYVTSRIIVHGFPATGVEHIYRNPRTEVQRLLDKYHKEHYKVYNFANEAGRTYPDQLFQGRTERFPFTDHTCPPLESVVNFCENAKAWLDMDEQNVVSLHCKAGKGRAGIMAACLLIRLGETARDAVSKYDATRVSDLKGLTVVNQRKWPFMYERLVKEVWGVRESIGMVPGQDPDLRAPALQASCLREVSIQLEPQAAGRRKSSSFLPNPSCAIYQQEPMGKTLVHRAKMVEVEPLEGESGSVFAAVFPRSAVVQGTFQVLISAAVGTVSTQKNVIDLWWNTTFLAADGGDQSFELSEMDVSPLKLAGRLHQAKARVVVRHTYPHAESPRRRVPLKPRALSSRSAVVGPPPPSAHPTNRTPETGIEAQIGRGSGGGGGSGESQPGASERLPPQTAPGKDNTNVTGNNRDGAGGNETVASAASPAGGDSAGGGVSSGREVASAAAAAAAEPGSVAEAEAAASERGVSLAAAPKDPAPEAATNRDALPGTGASRSALSSPTLPGPSPAGMSPVWTFEGRTPSNRVDASGRAIGDSRWTQSKMWTSNPGHSSGGPSPPPNRGGALPPLKALTAPEDRLREKWRALQRKRSGSRSMDSMVGHSDGSTAPTGTSSSMRGIGGGAGAGAGAAATKGRAFTFPAQRSETDSESDDQLAVRASAFEGGGGGSVPRVSMPAPSGIHREQWAIEMQMEFAQERRRWEEHQHCLETELNWALAARARAEARSEEDSARAEVLEERLAAWRSDYSMIERDVKQAVRLLEMSLSGLMSAETALRRWKGQVPPKVYDDILSCLTTGDEAPSNTVCDKE